MHTPQLLRCAPTVDGGTVEIWSIPELDTSELAKSISVEWEYWAWLDATGVMIRGEIRRESCL